MSKMSKEEKQYILDSIEWQNEQLRTQNPTPPPPPDKPKQ